MNMTSVTCNTNGAGTVATLNLIQGGLFLGNPFNCTSNGNSFTMQAITGAPTNLIELNDFLGLSVATVNSATRVTVCIAATVN
jgi:hypothetical protein